MLELTADDEMGSNVLQFLVFQICEALAKDHRTPLDSPQTLDSISNHSRIWATTDNSLQLAR